MSDVPTTENVERALNRAGGHLLSLQGEGGSWSGTNDAGPQSTAIVLVTQHCFHALTHHDAERAVKWMSSLQLDDGSFAASPGGTIGQIDVTGLVIAGFAAAGLAPDDQYRSRAQSWLDANGGWEKTQIQTRIFACAMGLVAPAALGKTSFLLRWIPHSDRMVARRFSFAVQLLMNLLQPVIRGMQLGHPLPPAWVFRFYQYGRTLKHLSHHQNTHGSWAGLVNTTALGVFAMHYLDVQIWDPRMQAAFRFLEHCKSHGDFGLRVSPYSSENWNTAGALLALLRIPKLDVRSAVSKGAAYLLQQQNHVGVAKDWENPTGTRSTAGGWAYGIGNQLTSDCDTTAYVLEALQAAGNADPEQANAIAAGREWLFNMQNDPGGWPAFSHGLKEKKPGPLFRKPLTMPQGFFSILKAFLNPPVEMGDPGWEDLTGRVLHSLGAQGLTLDDPHVQAGIRFLRAQLKGQDAWWGRWEVNYLSSSGYILQGLRKVGLPSDDPMITKVVGWMVSHQNSDGGWGESIESYADPGKAGKGPSDESITALVVSALIAVGGFDKEVDAGVVWLLSKQLGDGTWQLREPVAVLVPPDEFYFKVVTGQCVIVHALADYLQAKQM